MRQGGERLCDLFKVLFQIMVEAGLGSIYDSLKDFNYCYAMLRGEETSCERTRVTIHRTRETIRRSWYQPLQQEGRATLE